MHSSSMSQIHLFSCGRPACFAGGSEIGKRHVSSPIGSVIPQIGEIIWELYALLAVTSGSYLPR